ncbi:BspC domain-containing protein [Cupriavidus consociatus]|uniref:BspC domain-containing protein n=1 Tax=Cupriavidus consociatus TaxID=2821357 RepID=UPI003D744618
MIRRISELLGSRLRMVAAAVAGAIGLAGCANMPADEAAAQAPAAAPTAAPARPAPAPAASSTPPTKTITLPDRGRVSLSEYRARMREQLMKTENASSDVADCAAHASWVVPRSATYDALKIPTGALAAGQAMTEPWSGRFSPGKQAVPVSTVVTFNATAHKRRGDDWQPVRVRCGYDDGMMLAYELQDPSGATISEPAAAPAVPMSSQATSSGKSRKGAKGKSTAASKSGKSSAAKSTKSASGSAKASSKTKKKQ